jgi:hypothetical protein
MPAMRPRARALLVGAGAFVLAVVVVGGAIAASNPPTLYACYNTSGQVAMSDIAQCKLAGGGRLVYWSTAGVPGPTGPAGATGATGPTGPTGVPGDGVRTISGIVQGADGAALYGGGYTSSRLLTGIYRISFPAGSFTTQPVITANPLGVDRYITVSGIGLLPDGSGSVDLRVWQNGVLSDATFQFIAVASQPLP